MNFEPRLNPRNWFTVTSGDYLTISYSDVGKVEILTAFFFLHEKSVYYEICNPLIFGSVSAHC